MSLKRTPDIEPGTDFTAEVPITKAYVDTRTGQRHIIGVASGIAEDRDGERVSRNAIAKMAGVVKQGGVKLTSRHQQDWDTEIGDVVKAEHDAQTDELIVDTVLPPEGVDPIADKAWRVANSEKVGFSVGGKLLKSFFERTDTGKKRKVLDAIGLRHIALTKSPSYPHSFAEAVAKSWDPDSEPTDDEFTLDVEEEVEKDTTGSWAGGSSDSGGGNTGRDSVGSGQRNAGERKPDTKGMSTEEDGSDKDDEKDLPEAKDQERHLACPNCGHEFAADLPVDPDERQVDNDNDDDNDNDKDDVRATGKSVETKAPMSQSLSETLDALKALAAADDVTKTDDKPEKPAEAAAEPATEVAKTTDGGELDVAKALAASHRAHEERFGTLETAIGEGFELIAKSHKAMKELIEGLPQGRKSVARIIPPSTGHDGRDGEKTIEKKIEEAPDALSALKASNEEHWGIR